MNRLTSGFFVAALIRRVTGDGGFAAVVRKGAEDAGAIALVFRDREGGLTLFRPAPQTAYGEGSGERRFVASGGPGDQEHIDAVLAREVRFDSDLWVLEVETGGAPPETYIDIMPT